MPLEKGLHLTIKKLGYYDKTIEMQFADNSTNIDAGIVYLLEKIFEIDEIIIIPHDKFVTQKFDRTVFKITDDRKASATSIFDLLKPLPGIIISEDGNVKFKGTIADFNIDDQPLNLHYPKIEMIPIANIEKIELISGSTRGTGSGKGGIINIKMKKSNTEGFSGLYSLQAATINFKELNNSNGFANMNFKNNNIVYFTNISQTNSFNYNEIVSDGQLTHKSGTYLTNDCYNNNTRYNDASAQIGAVYSGWHKTKMVISGSLYYDRNNDIIDNTHKQTTITGNPYNEYRTDATHRPKNRLFSIGTFFTHTFDSLGTELSCGFAFENLSSGIFSSDKYTYQYLEANQVDNYTRYVENNNSTNYNLFYGSIYYNHAIRKNSRWNCGWQGWFYPNRILIDKYKLDETDNLPLSKTIKSAEQEQILFWRIGSELKKWKLDAGISVQLNNALAQNTRYLSTNKDTIISVNKKFINFLPSATISYSLGKSKELQMTYDRSVLPPYHEQFVDFVNKHDPLNWTNGNPSLQQVNYNNCYLGFLINEEKWNLSSNLFLSLTNNNIRKVKYPYTESISLTIPENIGKTQIIGSDVSSWIAVKKHIDLTLSTSIYYTSIDASNLVNKIESYQLTEDNLKRDMFGFNVKVSTFIKFSETSSGNFHFSYNSKNVSHMGYTLPYISSYVDFSKKLFSKKLLVSARINNLFGDLIKRGSRMSYLGLVQNTTDNSSYYKRSFSLKLQYTFNNGDRGTKNIRTR